MVSAVIAMFLGVVALPAQPADPPQAGAGSPIGMADDWTHRHLVFSRPAEGGSEDRLEAEPRFARQRLVLGRRLPANPLAPEPPPAPAPVYRSPQAGPQAARPGLLIETTAAQAEAARGKKPPPDPDPEPGIEALGQDWASTLPAAAEVGDGMYPAKFTFDFSAPPDCINDYVAFNTSVATGAVAASRTGTFTASPVAEQTVTIGGSLVLIASATSNAGMNFRAVGTMTNTTRASRLAAAITRNGAAIGVSATSSSGIVTVRAIVPGVAGNSITLVEGLTGFTWAGATLAGGVNGTRPSIVAYNNLYSTQSATLEGYCGGSGPSVRWAYATGSGAVTTSPVLSLDGSKIVYVETKTAGAVLHILQWKAGGEGTVAAPVTPAMIRDWSACAPGSACVVSLPFAGAPQATRSAPFYDYASDTAYVGDNAGRLHKFTPVLTGVPAEVTTGGWPVTVAAGFVLNGPVFEFGANRVFVTANTGATSRVCRVTSTPAVTCAADIAGIISDPVILDGSTGRLFAFSTLNGATVHQYDTSMGSAVTALVAGAGPNTNRVFAGTFNQAYYESSDGSGKLYVCGKNPASPAQAALFRLSISAGVMSASYDATPLVLTDGTGGCSPVTGFFNPSTMTEWIFLSVGNNAGPTMGATCNTADIGCVGSLNVTGTAWPPAAMTAGYVTPNNTANPSASGIVIDNTGGTTTVAATALTAAATAGATTLSISSADGFRAGDFVQVDAEAIQVTSTGDGTLGVARAQLGTTAASHLNGTAVVAARTTLLNGAVTNVSVTLAVDSTTAFNVDDYVQVDNEAMRIIEVPSATQLIVSRGRLGSLQAAHADNARVVNLSKYPQAASVYFTFAVNASTAARCNGTSGVGCAVKLTQDGLR